MNEILFETIPAAARIMINDEIKPMKTLAGICRDGTDDGVFTDHIMINRVRRR